MELVLLVCLFNHACETEVDVAFGAVRSTTDGVFPHVSQDLERAKFINDHKKRTELIAIHKEIVETTL